MRNSEELCLVVEALGYRSRGTYLPTTQLKNGAYVTSLLNFFNDNPGALAAVERWIAENFHEPG